MKEIRYILILVIGGSLFWLVPMLLINYAPRSWRGVIPDIYGTKSVNLTTSTFDITGDRWVVVWWPSEQNPNDKCVVEVYNASTDEKLQEFTLSTYSAQDRNERFVGLRMRGRLYLKIQVYKTRLGGLPWRIEVHEHKPPQLPPWMVWSAAIGIASLAAFFGYKKLKARTIGRARQTSPSIPSNFVVLLETRPINHKGWVNFNVA